MNPKHPYLWYVVLLLLSLFAKSSLESRGFKLSNRRPSLNTIDALQFSQSAKTFSFGFDQWIGGLIWVGLLQNASTEAIPEGKLSWEYSQLRSIVQLDRNFESAYSFGASFLSVFRQDKRGAKDQVRPNF